MFSEKDSTLVNTDANADTVKWQSRMGIRKKEKMTKMHKGESPWL